MALLAATTTWLADGLSGQVHATPPAWAYWHARAMVLGWSILLPTGMLIARFFKVMPRQAWPGWWITRSGGDATSRSRPRACC